MGGVPGRRRGRRIARPAVRVGQRCRSRGDRRAAPRGVAERERQQALEREQADRLAIVVEIEQLSGPGAVDRIAELRVRWDGLPPMPSEYAASLTRRFQDASRAFEDRERRRLLAEAAVGEARDARHRARAARRVGTASGRCGGALARAAARCRRAARARVGQPGRGRTARTRRGRSRAEGGRIPAGAGQAGAGQSAPAAAVLPAGRGAGGGGTADAQGR